MKKTYATWRDSRRDRMPGGQKWQVLKKDRQNLQLNTKQRNKQKKPCKHNTDYLAQDMKK